MKQLVLKVDGDGYPHVGGVRWSSEELLESYYESLEYNDTQNYYYYEFGNQVAQIQAYDEMTIVTDLEDNKARLLGNYEVKPVSPLYLDYKERPIIYVETNNTVIRALVSTSAYYDYVKKTPSIHDIPSWWQEEDVIQERESKQYNNLLDGLFANSSLFLKEHIAKIPPKSSWVFHPLSITGDVQFVAKQGHSILCCEPQESQFKKRLALDEEALLKKVSSQIEYFNNQFAPFDNREFDVFFDHGLINHVFPGDRKSFVDYIDSFQANYFMAVVCISHDFFGPPFGFTEKEFLETFIKPLKFEPIIWQRNNSFLYVLAKK